MNTDPRGTIFQQGNILRIDNAFVEEVFCVNDSNGHIIISYAMQEAGQTVSIETLRLNISRSTIVLNSSGQRLCSCCIPKGAWVNAVFSARMTRSIPPQANAFLIIVKRQPQAVSPVTIGRIAFIDPENNFLYTGNPNDINSQTRFVISNATTITDRFGRLIHLNSLRPGQLVQIAHANFQTASIPPQTTAFHIQLI